MNNHEPEREYIHGTMSNEQSIIIPPVVPPRKFPLLEESEIEALSYDQVLVERLNAKMRSLNHEAHYQWLGEELPSVTTGEGCQIRIFAVTWNKFGQSLNAQLNRLLRPLEVKHHLVIVATQECLRSIGMSIFCDSKVSWENHIYEALGKEYIMIASNKLNAKHLCIFAHLSIMPQIQMKMTSIVPTGFMNMVGNKGAIAIGLHIRDKSFLIVNNHLASGQHVQKARTQEFKKIHTTLDNASQDVPITKRYDYTIWMGDFNSRIDDRDLTIKSIHSEPFFTLLQKDQLFLTRNLDQAYKDFQEGMILFPPSYKLEPLTKKFMTGKEWRIPGWCDRILFQENQKTIKQGNQRVEQVVPQQQEAVSQQVQTRLELVNYDSATHVFGSDHRPVFAQFSASI